MVLIPFLLVSCIFTKPLNHPRVRRQIDPYSFRKDLPLFLASLTQYKNKRDLQRVEYYVMYFMLDEMVEIYGKHSQQGQLLERLLKLDVHQNPDSVAAVFKIAFKDLDPEPGPPNQFITVEIPARAEFILGHGCFHAGWELPFDQMAKDVARMGVPVVESFDDDSFHLYFGISNLARYYQYSMEHGYRCETPKPEFTLTGEPMPPDMRYMNPTESLLQVEMEKIENKIYVRLPYDQLHQILIQPFIYPIPCSVSASEDSSLNYDPWRCYRAGIDVFGILNEIESTRQERNSFFDLILKYSISNSVTTEVVARDSLRYTCPLTDAGNNKIYLIRTITEPFHRRLPDRPVANTDYLLDICVVAVIDSADDQFEGATRSEVYNLPDDTLQVPHYDLRLVSKKQRSVRQYSSPYENIPDFILGSRIYRGDTIEVWLPITDLPLDGSEYSGRVSVYLVEKQQAGGWAAIDENSIHFGQPGDTLRPDEIPGSDSPQADNQPLTIFSSEIRSSEPDFYYRFKAPVPLDMPKGESYMLAAFVYGFDPKTKLTRSVCTASMDVTVR